MIDFTCFRHDWLASEPPSQSRWSLVLFNVHWWANEQNHFPSLNVASMTSLYGAASNNSSYGLPCSDWMLVKCNSKEFQFSRILPVYSGRLEYIAVYFCTSVHGYAIHFIVHLSTLWDQLGGWTDRPKPKNAQYTIYCGLSTQAIYRERKKWSFEINWHKDAFARMFYFFTTAFCAF